jgi:hypothetical protein
VEPHRERLRDLSTRLVRLHRLLLDRERRAYESRHGAVPPGELFRLVLHDEQFAWLRSLSSMIAQIDAFVDADDAIADADVQAALRETHRLLKSDSTGEFHDKYRDALQDSPEVVMAHAEVSKALPR